MNKLREFTSDEVASLVREWVAVYCRDERSVNCKDFMWHIFSGGRYPALEGDQAQSEYTRQTCCEFIVLSNDRDEAFIVDSRPEDRPFPDFYVFPPNLAWTMAFTHEEGWLGPYFAKHTRYTELNTANATRVKKQQETVYSRSQGWY